MKVSGIVREIPNPYKLRSRWYEGKKPREKTIVHPSSRLPVTLRVPLLTSHSRQPLALTLRGGPFAIANILLHMHLPQPHFQVRNRRQTTLNLDKKAQPETWIANRSTATKRRHPSGRPSPIIMGIRYPKSCAASNESRDRSSRPTPPATRENPEREYCSATGVYKAMNRYINSERS